MKTIVQDSNHKVKELLEADILKMINLIRFIINRYCQSKVSLLFASNTIWTAESSKSDQQISDLHIFERWLIAYQIIYPNTFEALESIIEQNFKEGDILDLRNSYS